MLNRTTWKPGPTERKLMCSRLKDINLHLKLYISRLILFFVGQSSDEGGACPRHHKAMIRTSLSR